ncbi:MAG TPA: lysylphosphatidylglycerol synthase transmembrane domain-containing protein [Bacteroidales bacterium]
MAKKKEQDPFKRLRGVRVIYPVLIGLGVIAYFFYKKDFNAKAFSLLTFSTQMCFYLILALLFMMMRDIGYMMRIRILTQKDLSWKQAFRVIMLWEFSSAVMPSAVGGTTVAMIYVNKEGINLGRSTAVVMATSFLDELYFVLMFPLLLLTIKVHTLFSVGVLSGGGAISLTNEFLWFAVIGYSLKFVYIIVLGYGLFVNPRGLKWLLLGVFKLPFLRKFRYDAHITGTDIITSSRELRKQNFWFWLKAFGATFFSWSARYLVANALILAFFTVSDHFLLFARQLVMQNMLLLSPTPGGSGVAEAIFMHYLNDFILVGADLQHSFATVLALLWRLVSYYPYLIVGVIIFPWWLKHKLRRR